MMRREDSRNNVAENGLVLVGLSVNDVMNVVVDVNSPPKSIDDLIFMGKICG